jgi:hypothetical protein
VEWQDRDPKCLDLLNPKAKVVWRSSTAAASLLDLSYTFTFDLLVSMSVAGVISLTIQSAHIRPWSTLLRGGSPDTFVTVSINDGAEVGKTGYRSHEYVCRLLYTCNSDLVVSTVLILPGWRRNLLYYNPWMTL